MANSHHLEILSKGSATWNEWRQTQSERPDLSGADLHGYNLRNADMGDVNLAGADLQASQLQGCSFENATLKEALLPGADLRDTSLRGADFAEADLRGANLKGICAQECNFEGTDLSNANLSYADFGDDEIVDRSLSAEEISRDTKTQALITGHFAVPGYLHAPAYIECNPGSCFRKACLRSANLVGVSLRGVSLDGADLRDANLGGADLFNSSFEGSDLRGAILHRANLYKAMLRGAQMDHANLSCALLSSADLESANLRGANLQESILVNTNLASADLTGAHVFGISSWDLNLAGAHQHDLVITRSNQPAINVDDIEVAQFIYLLLNNEKIRSVIDTIGKNGVLLLGRFSDCRKAVLDILRTELRRRKFIPIVFDFERPERRDFTETIRTLAGLSRFVIADITSPKSTPLELQATVPEFMIPFVPIIELGQEPFSMFRDLLVKHSEWVLAPIAYASPEELLRGLGTDIIEPALARSDELTAKKAEKLTIRRIGKADH